MSCDFDLAKLADWMRTHAPDAGVPSDAEKFAGGQSNPTYKVTSDRGPVVLRRKPFGNLLPSAHAVDREFKLISGLHPTGFPVPKPIALCEDNEIIGAEFYLMEMMEGRTFWDGQLPDTPKEDRRDIYTEMVHTLAALHNVDYEKLVLAVLDVPATISPAKSIAGPSSIARPRPTMLQRSKN